MENPLAGIKERAIYEPSGSPLFNVRGRAEEPLERIELGTGRGLDPDHKEATGG